MDIQLARDRNVYISLRHDGKLFWLSDVENARNQVGTLYLKGTWNVDAAQAKPYSYETSAIIRRRLAEQAVPPTQISLESGDRATFLEE